MVTFAKTSSVCQGTEEEEQTAITNGHICKKKKLISVCQCTEEEQQQQQMVTFAKTSSVCQGTEEEEQQQVTFAKTSSVWYWRRRATTTTKKRSHSVAFAKTSSVCRDTEEEQQQKNSHIQSHLQKPHQYARVLKKKSNNNNKKTVTFSRIRKNLISMPGYWRRRRAMTTNSHIRKNLSVCRGIEEEEEQQQQTVTFTKTLSVCQAPSREKQKKNIPLVFWPLEIYMDVDFCWKSCCKDRLLKEFGSTVLFFSPQPAPTGGEGSHSSGKIFLYMTIFYLS